MAEEDGEFRAALPLVERRVARVLPAGDVPSNYWSASGELLLDNTCAADAVLDIMAGALAALPWPLLWLELVPCDAPHWQELLAALARRGCAYDVHRHYEIGQVEIAGSWNDYLAGRSKNLHRTLRRDGEALEAQGPLTFEMLDALAPDEVEPRLREAFEVETRSWKSRGGAAVLETPGMFEFYLREARQLAAWGELRIATLRLAGRPIAFEVGWTAKGVYHSFKVGYDAVYKRFAPGHLLRSRLAEACFASPGVRLIDFQGPLSEALTAWSTRRYAIGRLVIAPGGPVGRAALAAYRGLAPLVRRLRRVS